MPLSGVTPNTTALAPDVTGVPTMAEVDSTLVLLQILDSTFPVGSFTHSYGLEQAVRDGLVQDAADVEQFVTSALVWQTASADARALAMSHGRARHSDRDGLLAIDAGLYATKATAEMRAASTSMGQRLLQEVVAHLAATSDLAEWYLAAIEAGRAHGLYPVALGIIGAALGVPHDQLAAAFLFSSANTMHQAAMRLLPVSHRDTQGALHRARSTIAELVARDILRTEEPFASFAPLHEIASMRHERSTVRFFAS